MIVNAYLPGTETLSHWFFTLLINTNAHHKYFKFEFYYKIFYLKLKTAKKKKSKNHFAKYFTNEHCSLKHKSRWVDWGLSTDHTHVKSRLCMCSLLLPISSVADAIFGTPPRNCLQIRRYLEYTEQTWSSISHQCKYCGTSTLSSC